MSNYPGCLTGTHLLIDHVRLCRFMRLAWGMEVDPSDLNLLEYYGLVLPVRKALVNDLRFPRVERPVPGGTEVHEPRQYWAHTARQRLVQMDGSSVGPKLTYRPLNTLEDFADWSLRDTYPTPVLLNGYETSVQPTKTECKSGWTATYSFGKIEPVKPTCVVRVCNLKAGAWLRPLQPAYWGSLARPLSPVAPTTRSLSVQAEWIKELYPAAANPFTLDAEQAKYGNAGVTRFYVIGHRISKSARMDSLEGWSDGCGQDWWIAAFLSRLRRRIDLGLSLQVEASMQKRTTNAKKAILTALGRRWETVRALEELSLPPFGQYFYRDTLLWLTHRSRPESISPEESHRTLGGMAGLRPSSVKIYAAAGHRGLGVK